MSFLYYFKDLFTALILRPLIRDPFRTLITILGVAVGVAVFLSIRLANEQTKMSFTESVDLVLGRADAVIRAEGMEFDETHFEKLHVLRKQIKAKRKTIKRNRKQSKKRKHDKETTKNQ